MQGLRPNANTVVFESPWLLATVDNCIPRKNHHSSHSLLFACFIFCFLLVLLVLQLLLLHHAARLSALHVDPEVEQHVDYAKMADTMYGEEQLRLFFSLVTHLNLTEKIMGGGTTVFLPLAKPVVRVMKKVLSEDLYEVRN